MLKYLFRVQYADGTTFDQNTKDVSAVDPLRSAFYDVKQNAVECFQLLDYGGVCVAAVELEDGRFFIDEKWKKLHNEDLSGFRLIFFRKHKHTITEGVETDHEIKYVIGWQCTVDGKNYQQTIEIE